VKPSTLLALVLVAALAIGFFVVVKPRLDSEHKKGGSGPGKIVVTVPDPMGG